jgi:TolB-like protein/Tfp pilus assembly protein PilF
MGGPSLEMPSSEKASVERLDSWKEIATYLNRDVTTVQRWEKREGMPVHRHLHDKRGSVYALTSELDSWRGSRKPVGEGVETESSPVGQEAEPLQEERSATLRRYRATIAGVALAGLLVAGYFLFLKPRKHGVQPQPQIRSLAVLPLRNISGDSSQEYLADGLTEALIDRLAGIHNLRVVSRTSVMRFRNPQISVPEIAKSLGVDAVVEGSVVREGSRIRVTAQLIRGATDEHFWSETYDREMQDALSLESDLAQSIAAKIEATITGQEQRRLQAAARPVAPEVYESYLKGESCLDGGHGRSDIEASIAFFEDAINKDPTFAPAYMGLARAYTAMGTVYAGAPPSETRPKVISAARKALELDPDLAGAHVLLANTLQEEWQWAEAEEEYKHALELAPNDAAVHAGYALWLQCQGRLDEALEQVQRGRELDPLMVTGSGVAWTLFQAHRFDQAVREARSAFAVKPDDAGTRLSLGFALLGDNQNGDAVPVLEKAADLSKGSPAVEGILIRAYARSGRRADALRVLADLKLRRNRGYVPAAAFVNAYLGLDDKEQAFVWLEKAYQEKSNILQFVKTHPFFDPIRSDPRFADLVHRVGLD